MATVESLLKEVQDLSPDERHRLRDILNAEPMPTPELTRVRNKFAHQLVPPTAEELANIRAMLDRAGSEIGAAWKSNVSALEAVQEQRRDL